MAAQRQFRITTRYRFHPKYYLQPIDWLLIALAVVFFLLLLWYLCSPRPEEKKRTKRKQSGKITIIAANQTTQHYGTMAGKSKPSPPSSEGVEEAYHNAVVTSYQDELERVNRENSDLDDALHEQKVYTVEAYNAGREDQDEIHSDDVSKAYLLGRLQQAEIEEENIEKAYAVGRIEQAQIEQDNDLKQLQAQLAENLTLEKQALELEKKKVEAMEANAVCVKQQESADAFKTAMLDHERRLATLEAQRSNTNNITGLHMQIESQKQEYMMTQTAYAQALAQQRAMEEAQMQAKFCLISQQQTAAAALIEQQKREEEMQAQALFMLQQQAKEEEAAKQKLEMERMMTMRLETERIHKEKAAAMEAARKKEMELEALRRDLEVREAAAAAKEQDAQLALIIAEEENRRKRESIHQQYQLLEEKRLVDMLEAGLAADKIRNDAENDAALKLKNAEAELFAKRIAQEQALKTDRERMEAELARMEAELARKVENAEDELEYKRIKAAVERTKLQEEALSANYAITSDLSKRLGEMQYSQPEDAYTSKVDVTVTTKTVTKDTAGTTGDYGVGVTGDYASPAGYATSSAPYSTDYSRVQYDSSYAAASPAYASGSKPTSPASAPDYSRGKTNYESYLKYKKSSH
jgi:hypothetical protein